MYCRIDILQITTANNQCCEMHLSRAAERRLKKKGKRASKSESSKTNCCESSNGGHTLKFGSVAEIGYVVRSGVVFLVKCSAFAALGRMYVIRGSDYRDAHTDRHDGFLPLPVQGDSAGGRSGLC